MKRRLGSVGAMVAVFATALGGGGLVVTAASASAPVSLTASLPAPLLPWPDTGSGAVAIPALGVSASSPNERTAPIASLTKMMTVDVALQTLPIDVGDTGPHFTVSNYDVDIEREMVATDQSNVAIRAGEQLNEYQLLEGIFVHSAGDYAVMLQRLTGVPLAKFVGEMNATARSLGMEHTHYVDVTGINARSASTAADQLILVQLLMENPVIQQIVTMTSVRLPVAGVVTTYTPLLGEDGVVGIKSGFTDAAGGCDAMAVASEVDGVVVVTYAVVLGRHEGDVLYQAGVAARALVRAADSYIEVDPPNPHRAT